MEKQAEIIISSVINRFKELKLSVLEDSSSALLLSIDPFHDVIDSLEKMNSELLSVQKQDLSETVVESFASISVRVQSTVKILKDWKRLQFHSMTMSQIIVEKYSNFLANAIDSYGIMKTTYTKFYNKIRDGPNVSELLESPEFRSDYEEFKSNVNSTWNIVCEFFESQYELLPILRLCSLQKALQILHNQKDPAYLCVEIPQLIEVERFELGTDSSSLDIKYVVSKNKERLTLLKPVNINTTIDVWLHQLMNTIEETLRELFRSAHKSFPKSPLNEWIFQYPTQVVEVIYDMYWCFQVETSFSQPDVPAALSETLQKTFDSLATLLQLLNTNISAVNKFTVESLIRLTAFRKNVLLSLIQTGIKSKTDSAWTGQFRYQWDHGNDSVMFLIGDIKMVYGYNYINPNSLVRSFISENAFHLLLKAFHQKKVGYLYGVAGTGKTEIINELSRITGHRCATMNSSDSFDIDLMEKIIIYSLESGSWICFDEFNRLSQATADFMFDLLDPVFHSVSQGLTTITIANRVRKINPTAAFFMTANPGYHGSMTYTPKALSMSLPKAISVPEIGPIIESTMYCNGLRDADRLSRKLCKVNDLSLHQISMKPHYDFGIRSIRMVVTLCGKAKQNYPNLSEESILLKVLTDLNLPRMLNEDAKILRDILEEIFPGVPLPSHRDSEFLVALEKCLGDEKLKYDENFIEKVDQLHTILNERIGSVVLGPPSCGKSTVIDLLRKSYALLRQTGSFNQTFQDIQVYRFFPKALTVQLMFGFYDPETKDWVDGCVTSVIRSLVSYQGQKYHWIIFDGQADYTWMESLNTCLDDNRLICLMNGDWLHINPKIRFIFEIENQNYNSPATVSRCSHIYVPAHTVSMVSCLTAWIGRQLHHHLSQRLRLYLADIFEEYTTEALEFLKTSCSIVIYIEQDIFYYQTIYRNFRGLLISFLKENIVKETGLDEETIKTLFIYSLVWMAGGLLAQKTKPLFDNFVAGQLCRNYFPETHSIYDIVPNGKGFSLWSESQYSSPLPMVSVSTFWIPKWLSVDYPVLLHGADDTIIALVAHQLTSMNYSIIQISIDKNTSIDTISAALLQNMSLQSTTLIPSNEKQVVLLLKNINMGPVKHPNTQPILEVIRQLVSAKQFFDGRARQIDVPNIKILCSSAVGETAQTIPEKIYHLFNILSFAD